MKDLLPFGWYILIGKASAHKQSVYNDLLETTTKHDWIILDERETPDNQEWKEWTVVAPMTDRPPRFNCDYFRYAVKEECYREWRKTKKDLDDHWLPVGSEEKKKDEDEGIMLI
jgi:hypothetical protein